VREISAALIPQTGMPPLGSCQPNLCAICGQRVNKPTHYLRRYGCWMFPQGKVSDQGACFSPIHRRCVERQHVDPEYVYSEGMREQLEASQ
jgi:hypothetical protein